MHSQRRIDDSQTRNEANNFFSAPIHTHRLDGVLVEDFEVHFGEGNISARALIVDVMLQRILVDNDFVDCRRY